MMTRIKLNYYRAEDEMLVLERIKWRREMEERRKQAKEKEKEMAKLRAQAGYFTYLFLLCTLFHVRKTRSGDFEERPESMRRNVKTTRSPLAMRIWSEPSG